ncbi:MAG: four helix bundle protein [Bacteroidales bacterium]
MNNKEFGKRLEQRTKVFAIEIIRLSAKLPETIEYRVIRYQMTKSGSSVAANYREANMSRSKVDFYHKIRVCVTEASETSLWLEIINELKDMEQGELNKILAESDELLSIFISISNNLRKN